MVEVSRKEDKGLLLDGIFSVEGILTNEECRQYISNAEGGGGFVNVNFPPQYRSNDRILTIVPPIIERTLFHRLMPALNLSGTHYPYRSPLE